MSWHAAVDFKKAVTGSANPVPFHDYGKVLKVGPDVIVTALSDGANNAAYAHLGAQTVVRTALERLLSECNELDRIARHPTADTATPLFRALCEKVQADLKTVAAERLIPLDDLSATLIVMVASPAGTAAMRVGDGFIVYRQSGRRYEMMFQRRDPTDPMDFVTAPDAVERMEVAARPGTAEFLCASTDALKPLSIREPERQPRAPFFRPLDQCTALARTDDDIHRGIRAFLRSVRLADGLEKDCTLMLGGYRAGNRRAA